MNVGKWIVNIIFLECFSASPQPLFTGVDKDTLLECGKCPKGKSVSERIINGAQASLKQWPWMVGIYNSSDMMVCGGTIINRQYVLTAAHCFGNQDLRGFSVRLGTTLRTNSTQCSNTKQGLDEQNKNAEKTILFTEEVEDKISPNKGEDTEVICVDVENVCTPIQKNCELFMMDIALVKLRIAVNFTESIRPICLPENCGEIPSNIRTFIAGWGQKEVFDSLPDDYYNDYNYEDGFEEDMAKEGILQARDELSDYEQTDMASPRALGGVVRFLSSQELMWREISCMNNTQCSVEFNRTEVPDYMLCSPGGACFGDSGGPLMYENEGRWYLAGVVSDGPDDCLDPERPLLFIKVSHFLEAFIYPAMKRETDNDKKTICASEDARKQCVTKFYAFYNRTLTQTNKKFE
ncbi:tryptase gamma-like [Ixodes scapularis]|uniref:tryptase gamma-like n=1 Tax=Ixodes scapularis TaxID=6945 RepID=UPI001A9E1FD4|nr:tryptase gamma-like [Ixodes scapularis]